MFSTSSNPGKTQSLNFFLVDESLYFVDLPGYGYAKVSKQMRNKWQTLISSYVEKRYELRLVVVIIDIRHELKKLDRDLYDWLQYNNIPSQLVYTKADKLTRNKQAQHAAALDAALSITQDQRVVFSAKTGQGLEQLKQSIMQHGTRPDTIDPI